MDHPDGEATRPHVPPALAETQPHRRHPPTEPSRAPRARSWLPGAALGLLLAAYLFAPFRSTLLVMGTDRRAGEGEAARTDTMILTTVLPLRPYVGMLSIPRDLWVEIPGFGPNRINAAYFLAEAARPGSGPAAAVTTVSTNFGLDVDGYVVVEFGGFERFVDALGGLQIDLAEPLGDYGAGRHLLNGTQALAFVRDRRGDDFFRMAHAQVLLKGLPATIWRPAAWPRLPLAGLALVGAVRTNVPVYLWPRLALALLRVGPGGIDGRTIGRDMAHGFTTEGGAQVLTPDWSRINPVLLEMFGQ